MFFGKQMHGATAALAASRFFTKQLTHDLARRDPCTQGMDVIAVSAAKPVVLALHRADDTSANGFLSVVEMNEAKHLAPVVHLGAFVLEAPTQGHIPVQV